MKICIGGYAGCGNIGDDAILEGYLRDQPRENITVLTGDPKRDSRKFGVRCVGRMNPARVISVMRESDVFVCGGGSLLQNATGNPSLMYYLTLMRLARLCGCEVRLLAAGIGPIHGERAARRTVAALRECGEITVRDGDSRGWLMERGLSGDRIRVIKDPAASLELPPPDRLAYLKHEQGMGMREDYCCIVLQKTNRQQQNRLIDELSALVKRYGVTPVLLLFDSRSDRAVSRCVANAIGGRVVALREASEGLAWIGGGLFTVSMRLHPLIFACRTGAPSLGLSADSNEPKLKSFCGEMGIPHLFLSEL